MAGLQIFITLGILLVSAHSAPQKPAAYPLGDGNQFYVEMGEEGKPKNIMTIWVSNKNNTATVCDASKICYSLGETWEPIALHFKTIWKEVGRVLKKAQLFYNPDEKDTEYQQEFFWMNARPNNKTEKYRWVKDNSEVIFYGQLGKVYQSMKEAKADRIDFEKYAGLTGYIIDGQGIAYVPTEPKKKHRVMCSKTNEKTGGDVVVDAEEEQRFQDKCLIN